jgi:predicted metal-binding protein
VAFHFEKKVAKPEDRHAWAREVNQGLVKLETAVFLSGYDKAFMLVMDSCSLCADCPGTRVECKSPELARPTPESMAVDVYATVKQYGYPIEVLTDSGQRMNRYALLMIE